MSEWYVSLLDRIDVGRLFAENDWTVLLLGVLPRFPKVVVKHMYVDGLDGWKARSRKRISVAAGQSCWGERRSTCLYRALKNFPHESRSEGAFVQLPLVYCTLPPHPSTTTGGEPPTHFRIIMCAVRPRPAKWSASCWADDRMTSKDL